MNLFHDIFLALSKNIIAYHKQLKRYYKYWCMQKIVENI